MLYKKRRQEVVEQLREELHRAIQVHGIAHKKTLEVSQRLDVEIVKDYKRGEKNHE